MGMIMAAVVFFSLLAWWKLNAVMFMLAAAASITTGLYWFDLYTTNIGLSISLAFIGYGLLCVGLAFRFIFWREDILE